MSEMKECPEPDCRDPNCGLYGCLRLVDLQDLWIDECMGQEGPSMSFEEWKRRRGH